MKKFEADTRVLIVGRLGFSFREKFAEEGDIANAEGHVVRQLQFLSRVSIFSVQQYIIASLCVNYLDNCINNLFTMLDKSIDGYTSKECYFIDIIIRVCHRAAQTWTTQIPFIPSIVRIL